MSIDWGGIIAGALGGGAQAVQQQAQGYIEDERKTDVAKAMAEIELNSKKALTDYQMGKQREQATWEVSDPTFTAAKDARKRAEGGIENELALARDKGVRQNANDAQVALLSDPKYIKGEAALARARHIESSASLAQAALTRLQVEDAKTAQALRNELDAAVQSGNEELQEKVKARISARAFAGKDTAKALGAWQTAQAKISEIEAKLADKMLDPAEGAKLKAELQQQRVMADFSLKELTGKAPPAAPPPELNQQTLDLIRQAQSNPALMESLKNKLPPGALAAGLAQLKAGQAPATSQPEGTGILAPAMAPKPRRIVSVTPQADGRGMAEMSDGTRRFITPEVQAIWQRTQNGDPTNPRERALLDSL